MPRKIFETSDVLDKKSIGGVRDVDVDIAENVSVDWLHSLAGRRRRGERGCGLGMD
jgi:hypothetical protein